jgi:hypothetical protein
MIDPFVVLVPLLILAFLGLVRFIGCEPFGAAVTPAEKPTFDPPPGSYVGAQSVMLLSSPGALIRFTTDGGDPSLATSQTYSGRIPVPATTTIRAQASGDAYAPSPIADGTFVITPAPPLPSTPRNFVQLVETHDATNNSDLVTATFNNAVAPGNLLIVWISYKSQTETVNGVTDTALNIYKPIVGPTTGPASFPWRTDLYYCSSAKGSPSLQVTARFSNVFAAEKNIHVHEYSGGIPNATPDVPIFSVASNANATVGPLPVAANELVFAAVLFSTSGVPLGPEFTQRSSLNNNVTEDQIATSPTATARFTNTAQDWIAQMVAFK